MSNPSTLLLDEPAGGLGEEEILELKEFVAEFRRDRSVLLIEHHMDVIMTLCDRIYVLNFGELIAHGTPREIKENPAVIAAYLGSENHS
jgi:branched-chain amino acid transport system ATP-binding protein